MSILRHVTQTRLRKLKSYMFCINTKYPGQECGGFVGFLEVFVCLFFFFQVDIFYGDAVRGNLSSHAPLESKYLMFSYINCNSVLDSLEKRFIY